MNFFLKTFKPLLKMAALNLLRNNQDRIVTYILRKVELPISGEQEEEVITKIYNALETIILNIIDEIGAKK
jgi:hypothetical protein